MGCNDTGGADHVEGLLWAGFAGMAVPAAYFASVTQSVPDGQRKYYIVTTFICMIASLAYLAMATGNGVYVRPFDGREFFYGRYIDWFFTTPLCAVFMFAISFTTSRRLSASCTTDDAAFII